MFKFIGKVLAFATVIACMVWAMTGPFQVLINMASTFAVFGAIITAIIAVLGGGWLAWLILASILRQALKEST